MLGLEIIVPIKIFGAFVPNSAAKTLTSATQLPYYPYLPSYSFLASSPTEYGFVG